MYSLILIVFFIFLVAVVLFVRLGCLLEIAVVVIMDYRNEQQIVFFFFFFYASFR